MVATLPDRVDMAPCRLLGPTMVFFSQVSANNRVVISTRNNKSTQECIATMTGNSRETSQ